jgi:nitrous oxidase accessory protein NosD
MLTARISVFALGTLLLVATMAEAQATRTWVSGVGDDVNPCSRTAPCKTFAGAISKTAAGGEINVLDPGGYGAVTITKSISIVNEGTHDGVLVTLSGNGIVVNAGVNDIVVLRGLDINGVGTGGNGIRFLAGRSLHVEDCRIYGFAQRGIEAIAPTAGALLSVKDSMIRNNAGGAIMLGGVVSATIDRTRIERNSYGVRTEATNDVTIANSTISGNTTYGINTVGGVFPMDVTVESSVISYNDSAGIRSSGATSTVRISNVSVVYNATGLASPSGGLIVSSGNNRIFGNGTDGAPTSTTPLQ